MPGQGKRKSVDVSSRRFAGYCAPGPSGVDCLPVLVSGTASSNATYAGKRMMIAPTCSNSSPKTQTWQRSYRTVQQCAPISAQQSGRKRGGQPEQCLGRSRGGFNSKIHLLIDATDHRQTGHCRHPYSLLSQATTRSLPNPVSGAQHRRTFHQQNQEVSTHLHSR